MFFEKYQQLFYLQQQQHPLVIHIYTHRAFLKISHNIHRGKSFGEMFFFTRNEFSTLSLTFSHWAKTIQLCFPFPCSWWNKVKNRCWKIKAVMINRDKAPCSGPSQHTYSFVIFPRGKVLHKSISRRNVFNELHFNTFARCFPLLFQFFPFLFLFSATIILNSSFQNKLFL